MDNEENNSTALTITSNPTNGVLAPNPQPATVVEVIATQGQKLLHDSIRLNDLIEHYTGNFCAVFQHIKTKEVFKEWNFKTMAEFAKAKYRMDVHRYEKHVRAGISAWEIYPDRSQKTLDAFLRGEPISESDVLPNQSTLALIPRMLERRADFGKKRGKRGSLNATQKQLVDDVASGKISSKQLAELDKEERQKRTSGITRIPDGAAPKAGTKTLEEQYEGIEGALKLLNMLVTRLRTLNKPEKSQVRRQLQKDMKEFWGA